MSTPLKRLEGAVKGGLARTLARLLPMPARTDALDCHARPHRVLFLRYNRIGDMIMSTGVIRAIATSHPAITVDVLASPSNAPVLHGNPHVGNLLTFAIDRPTSWPRLLRQLRRARYDVVVDGMAAKPKPQTALLMLAAGARHRIGLHASHTGRLYTRVVGPAAPGVHHVMEMALLVEPFGVAADADALRPELFVTAEERAEAERKWRAIDGVGNPRAEWRLLVNVATAEPRREWPDDCTVALLSSLADRAPAVRPLIIAPPNASTRAARLARDSGAAAATPGLREAWGLVATSDVVLTPDTSISHAAAALRKPAVVLLYRGNEHLVPYRTPGRNVFGEGRSLRSIAVHQVVAALEAVLAEERTGVVGQGS